jgi:hypothetical protein
MREISYAVRGYLTVRGKSVRVPVRGSLALRTDPDSGQFTGDLALEESAVSRTFLGIRLLRATVQITPESPVVGGFDLAGKAFATVMVSAAITAVELAGHPLRDGSCRTATHAVVPLRAARGFDLDRGGRLTGRYLRPSFTGRGRITPLINAMAAGPSTAVIDLTPVTSGR